MLERDVQALVASCEVKGAFQLACVLVVEEIRCKLIGRINREIAVLRGHRSDHREIVFGLVSLFVAA